MRLQENFLDDLKDDELVVQDDLTTHSRDFFEDGLVLHFSVYDQIKRDNKKMFREIALRIERILKFHRHINDYTFPILESTFDFGFGSSNSKQTYIAFSIKQSMKTVFEVLSFIYSILKTLSYAWR